MLSGKHAFDVIRRRSEPYYLYILSRPCGTPFYVGIGTGRRLLDHELFAKRPALHDHKLNVIRKIWGEGATVGYQLCGWFEDRAEAEIAERAFIAELGRVPDGPLTNLTDGGEGAPSPSAEVTEARSRSLRRAWSARAARDPQAAMAHLHNWEVWAKSAASRRGKKRGKYKSHDKSRFTEQRRAELSARLKADPVSRRPGVAEKISVTKRQRKSSTSS